MTIPANIKTELTELEAQIIAAGDLQNASGPTIIALQLNTFQLLNDVDSALASAEGNLDNWAVPTDPQAIISGVLGIVGNATDQNTLCNMEGYVSRISLNLELLAPPPKRLGS